MVPLLVILTVFVVATLYFAFEASRLSRVVQDYEGENAELRERVAVLIGQMQRLRESAGLHTDAAIQSPDDELMPLRQGLRNAGRGRPVRAVENAGAVVIVSGDGAERSRLAGALTANGYTVLPASLAEAPRLAHEISTAALVFDLREPEIAGAVPEILSAFAADPLAREVPVFALVGTTTERERLIDEGPFSAAFVVPTDTALFTSSIKSAIIRRRTRTRRAETARTLSSALSRP